MNKAELIQQLEGQIGSKKEAADALNAVIDTITRAVAKGEKVSITGFGTFEKVTRAARKGRNPRTGESVRIKRTTVPKFRPGASFKGFVADPKSLPKPEKPAKKVAAKATTKPAAAKKATAKATTKAAAPKKTTAKATTKVAAKKTTAKAATKAAAPKKATATKKAAATKKATATKTTAKAATKKATATKAVKKTTATKAAPKTAAKKTAKKAAK